VLVARRHLFIAGAGVWRVGRYAKSHRIWPFQAEEERKRPDLVGKSMPSPLECSLGASPGQDAMLAPVNRSKSPVSTVDANPVNGEVPRGRGFLPPSEGTAG